MSSYEIEGNKFDQNEKRSIIPNTKQIFIGSILFVIIIMQIIQFIQIGNLETSLKHLSLTNHINHISNNRTMNDLIVYMSSNMNDLHLNHSNHINNIKNTIYTRINGLESESRTKFSDLNNAIQSNTAVSSENTDKLSSINQTALSTSNKMSNRIDKLNDTLSINPSDLLSVPGSNILGRFIDPENMVFGRHSMIPSYRQKKLFSNPWDDTQHWKVDDRIDVISPYSVSTVSASIEKIESFNEYRHYHAAKRGFGISIANIFSLGKSTETQSIKNFLDHQGSAYYFVERKVGVVEMILKANIFPYLKHSLQNKLELLPRPYVSEQHKEIYKTFFSLYGAFYVSHVWTGGRITARVSISDSASIEAQHTATAVNRGIKIVLGSWAGASGGGSGSFISNLNEKVNSNVEVIGGDHANPSFVNVSKWNVNDYQRWVHNVRKVPKNIEYRVSSIDRLTNNFDLKNAINNAINDIYGNNIPEIAQWTELTHRYQTFEDNTNRRLSELRDGGFCIFKRTGSPCPSWAPVIEGSAGGHHNINGLIGTFSRLDDGRYGSKGHGYYVTICCSH